MKKKTSANVMAVLKCTHILLSTKTSLYVRPASEKESPVLRMPFGDKSDLLHLESHSVYDYHRKGGTDMPADFKEKLAWETSWVDKVMAGDFDNLRYRATMLLKKRSCNHHRCPTREHQQRTSRAFFATTLAARLFSIATPTHIPMKPQEAL